MNERKEECFERMEECQSKLLEVAETSFLLTGQQCLPSTCKTPETQNRSGGRRGWMDTKGQVGVKGRQRSSETLAQIQLDPTSRMFYAIKGISGPGLRVAGEIVKVKR